MNDYAYTAGYIDGDGCFYLGKTIQKRKNITVYEYNIQIVSVRPEVLFSFKQQFGGAVSQKPKRPKHKIPYFWCIKGQTSYQMSLKIVPYLIDKKIACQFFIELSERVCFNNFNERSEEELNARDKIIQNIREDRHMDNFVTKESIDSLKNLKKTISPTEEDFAYFAGLMDSEGCFRVKNWLPKGKPNKVHAIHVEIGNTKFPIFPWLIKRFGGNITFHVPKRNTRPVAIWSLSSKSLYEILPKVYPFLRSKKEACRKLMEFQETIIPNGGDRHSEEFKTLYTAVFSKRERIIQEIHDLNSTGSD